jgi:hypothetical protein
VPACRSRGPLAAAAALICLLPAIAGCGNARTPVPDYSRFQAPTGHRLVPLPRAGLELQAPANWLTELGSAPLIAVISSGPATISVWRYQRRPPPPASATELSRTRAQLIGAAQARDPTLRVIRTKVAQIDRAQAIELDAVERIAGQQRRVRSIHMFLAGAELVLEEYAPVDQFHAVDHAVFSPLKRSLRLIGVTR